MKRLILTIVLSLGFIISAFAAEPSLACEKFLQDSYVKNPNTTVSFWSDRHNKFCKYLVKNDEKLVREIIKAIEADRNKTDYRVENYEKGVLMKCILNFNYKNGGEKNVTFKNDGNGRIELTISERIP